jgi:hypothetical protein
VPDEPDRRPLVADGFQWAGGDRCVQILRQDDAAVQFSGRGEYTQQQRRRGAQMRTYRDERKTEVAQ